MPVSLLGLSMKEAAARFNLPVWKIREVYLRKLLAEPGRCGMGRVIPIADLPKLERALRTLRYIGPNAKPPTKKRKVVAS
jgi:hypothetical protein